MKTVQNRIKYLCISTLAIIGSTVSAFAQGTPIDNSTLKDKIGTVPTKIAEIASPIINIALAIVGVIAVGVAVWAYAKKKKGDGNANDGLMDAAWTTLAIVAFIYVVKAFFFGL